MSRYKESAKKKALVESFLSTPIQVGELVYATDEYGKSRSFTITKTKPLMGQHTEYRNEPVKIDPKSITKRSTRLVGEDPFKPEERIKGFQFPLEGLIGQLQLGSGFTATGTIDGTDILECQINPVVEVNGRFRGYQRDCCWTLRQKQSLIESIYCNVDCGKIVVRLRSYIEIAVLKKAGIEPSFRDVVDGKQRLIAISEFIRDQFTDMWGNYYSDLSDEAQYKFNCSQVFGYCEMYEDTSDEAVLRQFLKMNHGGVPQDPKHLEYVNHLYSKKTDG